MDKLIQNYRCIGPLQGCIAVNCRHYFNHPKNDQCDLGCSPTSRGGVKGAKCITVSQFEKERKKTK